MPDNQLYPPTYGNYQGEAEFEDDSTLLGRKPSLAYPFQPTKSNFKFARPSANNFIHGVLIAIIFYLLYRNAYPPVPPQIPDRIPQICHFIINTASVSKPFDAQKYVAMRAALEIQKPEKLKLYYVARPTGFWWDEIQRLDPKRIEIIQLDEIFEIFGNKVNHPAHKSDLHRLQILDKEGGIYMDNDAILLRSLQPFMNHTFVLAHEYEGSPTYGNALMLAEPNSTFGQIWYNEYHRFDDNDYAGASTWKAFELYAKYPEIVTGLKHTRFYPWTFHETDKIFNEDHYDELTDQTHAIHLWTSENAKMWDGPLVDDVWQRDTTFNKIIRPYLEEFRGRNISVSP